MSAPQRMARLLLGRPAHQIAWALQQQGIAQHQLLAEQQGAVASSSGACCCSTSHSLPGPWAGNSWSARGASTSSSQAQHTQAMQLANALSLPAKSLQFERPPIRLPPPLDNKMGKFLLSMLGFYSHKSQLLHGGQALYAAVKEQCDDGALIKAFGLDPSVFFSTYTLLSLHVWLVIHRLGSHTDRDSREFKQRFYENFQNDVERRVHRSVSVGVTKWLKQLETVFYSAGISFDKVLSGESKETFTEVILRHHFGNDVAKKSQAALLAKYVQRELHCLQLTGEEDIFRGSIRFSQEPFEGIRAAAPRERQDRDKDRARDRRS